MRSALALDFLFGTKPRPSFPASLRWDGQKAVRITYHRRAGVGRLVNSLTESEL